MIDGASDRTEATSFFNGNGAENLNAVATTSFSETKIHDVFQKTSLWTITTIFSHSLGRKATVAPVEL